MKKYQADIIRYMLIVVVVIGLFAVFIYDFNTQLKGVLEISNHELISESSAIHTESVVSRFNNQFTLLKSLSRQYTSWGIGSQDMIFNSMRLNVEDGNFTSMAIARLDGEAYTDNQQHLDVSERRYFLRALKGEMVVSRTSITSMENGEKVIVFAVPIYQNNEVNGVLIAVHNNKSLDKLLSNNKNAKSVVFLCDTDANAISRIICAHVGKDQENFIDMLTNSVILNDTSTDKILDDMKKGESGMVHFSHNQTSHYVSYQPLGINEWYSFTMIIPDAVVSQSNSIARLMLSIALKMIVVFALLMIYILYTQAKARKTVAMKNEMIELARRDLESIIMHTPIGIFKQNANDNNQVEYASQGLYNILGYSRTEITENFTQFLSDSIYPPDRVDTLENISSQLSKGKKLSIQYRILTKSGERRWVNIAGNLVPDANEQLWLYASMTDITEMKEAEDRLLISEQRYRIISEQSRGIIFDYDIDTGKITYTGNYYEKFGNYPVTDNFPQSAIDFGFIYKDDEKSFLSMFDCSKPNIKVRTAEFRIITGKGDYIWVELIVSLVIDSEGKPVRFIGKITDIDDQKRHLINLSLMAKTDQLTNLLNKASGSALMNDELKRTSSTCALLVIDLDGFKAMNDTLGHLVGDRVLSDFAKILKRRYRSSDIISRFGGDEFTVLLKAIPDKEFVKISCNQIIEQIASLNYGEDNKLLKITASIGIYFIQEGDTQGFLSAYSKADSALYDAKSAGKACYSVYKEEK